MATTDAYESVLSNVGPDLVSGQDAYESVLTNAGPAVGDPYSAYEYGFYGDVDTSVPTPWIWHVRPSAARPSDGVELVGHGFGQDQADHNGVVEADQGGTWVAVSVTDWDRVAPTADAYTVDRVISLDEIDPEHEVIAITVPSWAVPPGVAFRVVTDD